MARETLKVHSKGGFTTIYNLTIRDNNLSNKSLGLLVKLLSLPENWNFSFNGIVAICKDGKSAVSTEMEELKAAGYLYIDKVRDKDGTYLYNYNVYDTPQEELIRAYKEKKSLKNKEINPEPDFPVLDNPELENQVIYQRNNIKEEIIKDKKDKNYIINSEIELDNILEEIEKLPDKKKTKEDYLMNPFVNKLIKENYITSHDDELAFYDAFFNTLLEKGFSMNDINIKVDYVLHKLNEREFKDERGDDIKNRFKYLSSSVWNNFKRDQAIDDIESNGLFDPDDCEGLFDAINKNRTNDMER